MTKYMSGGAMFMGVLLVLSLGMNVYSIMRFASMRNDIDSAQEQLTAAEEKLTVSQAELVLSSKRLDDAKLRAESAEKDAMSSKESASTAQMLVEKTKTEKDASDAKARDIENTLALYKDRLGQVERELAMKGNQAPAFAPAQTGGVNPLAGRIFSVKNGNFVDFDQMMDAISPYPVIFAGEVHDQMEAHLAQFAAINALYKKNKDIVIGLEMFERPEQPLLDGYLNGTISDQDFKAAWRWGFDFEMYRPIFEFAKKNKLRMVALNAPREVVKAVREQGLSNISADMRSKIATNIDLDNKAHKDNIMGRFAQHGDMGGKMNFDFFYQAQCVWEDTMAESTANAYKEAVAKSPKSQVVVVIGGGHVNFGFGVPDRTKSRISKDFASFLCDPANEQVSLSELDNSNISNFMWFTRDKTFQNESALGISFNSDSPINPCSIMSVTTKGAADRAGIAPGDVIVKFDGKEVSSKADLYARLMSKKSGDEADVTVLRSGSSKTFKVVMN